MSDDKWWKERLAEEYFMHDDEVEVDEKPKSKMKELVLCKDGVYRPEDSVVE